MLPNYIKHHIASGAAGWAERLFAKPNLTIPKYPKHTAQCRIPGCGSRTSAQFYIHFSFTAIRTTFLSLVMKPALNDGDMRIIKGIHQAMFLIDTP